MMCVNNQVFDSYFITNLFWKYLMHNVVVVIFFSVDAIVLCNCRPCHGLATTSGNGHMSPCDWLQKSPIPTLQIQYQYCGEVGWVPPPEISQCTDGCFQGVI